MTTLLEQIKAAQSHCYGKFVAKRLLIYTPLAVIEQVNSQKRSLDLFDPNHYFGGDTDDYVYLRLFPKYDTENDQLGEQGFQTTFSRSAIAGATNTRRGFKATIKERRCLPFDVVRQIALISKSSSFQRFTPIKVLDFCSPESVSDRSTALFGGELATLRYGAIAFDNNIPGKIPGHIDDYLASDWGFTFKESMLRLA